jgi:FkbM family methyltransferase
MKEKNTSTEAASTVCHETCAAPPETQDRGPAGRVADEASVHGAYNRRAEKETRLNLFAHLFRRPKDVVAEFMIRHIKRGDVVFDIGANVGQMTRLAAQRVGPTGTVVAFEPNANLHWPESLGNAPNVTLHRVALSDGEQDRTLHLDVTNKVASSFHQMYGAPSRDTVVHCITLDGFCEKTGLAPSFIKMDCEQHEPFVFAGGWATIERFWPTIVLEFPEMAPGYPELFARLSLRYILLALEDGTPLAAPFVRRTSLGYCNVACVLK